MPGNVAGLIGVLLLLADGFIFGVAAKKAVTSIILIIVGILLAGFVGVVIPFLTVNDILAKLTSLFASQVGHIGAIIYAFPVFWIVGFALGLWKG